MIEGVFIIGGIMIFYWIDFGLLFVFGFVVWRFFLVFQIVFCLFIFIFVLSLLEFLCWFVFKGCEEEVKDVIVVIVDVDCDDKFVVNEFKVIKEIVFEMSKGIFFDFFVCD